jgi:hypothetical protein
MLSRGKSAHSCTFHAHSDWRRRYERPVIRVAFIGTLRKESSDTEAIIQEHVRYIEVQT